MSNLDVEEQLFLNSYQFHTLSIQFVVFMEKLGKYYNTVYSNVSLFIGTYRFNQPAPSEMRPTCGIAPRVQYSYYWCLLWLMYTCSDDKNLQSNKSVVIPHRYVFVSGRRVWRNLIFTASNFRYSLVCVPKRRGGGRRLWPREITSTSGR